MDHAPIPPTRRDRRRSKSPGAVPVRASSRRRETDKSSSTLIRSGSLGSLGRLGGSLRNLGINQKESSCHAKPVKDDDNDNEGTARFGRSLSSLANFGGSLRNLFADKEQSYSTLDASTPTFFDCATVSSNGSTVPKLEANKKDSPRRSKSSDDSMRVTANPPESQLLLEGTKENRRAVIRKRNSIRRSIIKSSDHGDSKQQGALDKAPNQRRTRTTGGMEDLSSRPSAAITHPSLWTPAARQEEEEEGVEEGQKKPQSRNLPERSQSGKLRRCKAGIRQRGSSLRRRSKSSSGDRKQGAGPRLQRTRTTGSDFQCNLSSDRSSLSSMSLQILQGPSVCKEEELLDPKMMANISRVSRKNRRRPSSRSRIAGGDNLSRSPSLPRRSLSRKSSSRQVRSGDNNKDAARSPRRRSSRSRSMEKTQVQKRTSKTRVGTNSSEDWVEKTEDVVLSFPSEVGQCAPERQRSKRSSVRRTQSGCDAKLRRRPRSRSAGRLLPDIEGNNKQTSSTSSPEIDCCVPPPTSSSRRASGRRCKSDLNNGSSALDKFEKRLSVQRSLSGLGRTASGTVTTPLRRSRSGLKGASSAGHHSSLEPLLSLDKTSTQLPVAA